MNFNELVQHIEIDGQELKLVKPLAKKEYAKFKALMHRAGGAWSVSSQSFHFVRDPQMLVDRLVEWGSDSFNKFQLYETPEVITDFISETSLSSFSNDQDTQSIEILEPNIGGAALVLPVIKALQERYPDRQINLTGFDIDPINVALCEQLGIHVTHADFLKVNPEPKFDIVLMNPPFAGRTYQKHIFHARKFLKPRDGALLIAVSPTRHIFSTREGFLSNDGDRMLYSEAFKVDHSFLTETFDNNTFEGANVQTSVYLLKHEGYTPSKSDVDYWTHCNELSLENISPDNVRTNGDKSQNRNFREACRAANAFAKDPTAAGFKSLIEAFLVGVVSSYSDSDEAIEPIYLPLWTADNPSLVKHIIRLYPHVDAAYSQMFNTDMMAQFAADIDELPIIPYRSMIQEDNQFAMSF